MYVCVLCVHVSSACNDQYTILQGTTIYIESVLLADKSPVQYRTILLYMRCKMLSEDLRCLILSIIHGKVRLDCKGYMLIWLERVSV